MTILLLWEIGRSARLTEFPLVENGRSTRSTIFPLDENGRSASPCRSTVFPFPWENIDFKRVFVDSIYLFWCVFIRSIHINLISKDVIILNDFKSSLKHFKLFGLTWYVHFNVNYIKLDFKWCDHYKRAFKSRLKHLNTLNDMKFLMHKRVLPLHEALWVTLIFNALFFCLWWVFIALDLNACDLWSTWVFLHFESTKHCLWMMCLHLIFKGAWAWMHLSWTWMLLNFNALVYSLMLLDGIVIAFAHYLWLDLSSRHMMWW